MLRAARRRVVEVAEECDPCRVLDAARAGHEGREGLREEELVDAREVAHERERRRVDPLRVDIDGMGRLTCDSHAVGQHE